MARAREVIATLSSPSLVSHGRYGIEDYFIIGLQGLDKSILPFRRRGGDNPAAQVQVLVDFINRFAIRD